MTHIVFRGELNPEPRGAGKVENMLTKQEMFNRAWLGLKSQGFTRCVDYHNGCVYSDGKGHHCAWGWVDPEATEDVKTGSVYGIKHVGLARELTGDYTDRTSDMGFATGLQDAHDNAGQVSSGDLDVAVDMQRRLRLLAAANNLSIPDEDNVSPC